MYQRINERDFIEAFDRMGRLDTPDSDGGNFTIDGCRALFDYLEDWIGEFQDGTGETYELDVNALCCEFAEYDNVQDAVGHYTNAQERAEIIYGCPNGAAEKTAIGDWLRDQTTVIEIPGTDRIVIRSF